MSEFIVLGLGMTLKEAAREPMQWPLQLGQPFRQDSGQALPRSVQVWHGHYVALLRLSTVSSSCFFLWLVDSKTRTLIPKRILMTGTMLQNAFSLSSFTEGRLQDFLEYLNYHNQRSITVFINSYIIELYSHPYHRHHHHHTISPKAHKPRVQLHET